MSEASPKSSPPTLWDSPTAISSPASAAFLSAPRGPAGPTTADSGPAASPARTSPAPAKALDSRGRVVASGGNSIASLPPADPRASSWRTSLLCALGDLTRLPLVWKKSATPGGRRWWVLGLSAHRTDATGCGSSLSLWPTPTQGSGGPEAQGITNQSGSRHHTNLLRAAQGQAWHTPMAADAKGSQGQVTGSGRDKGHLLKDVRAMVSAWPTPSANDDKALGHATPGHSPQLRHLPELLAGPPGPASPSTDGKRQDWPTPAQGMGQQSEYYLRGNPTLIGAARADWPTPRAENSEQTGAHGATPDTLTSAARQWPTPHGMATDGAPRMQGPTGNELGRAVTRQEWPTPNAALADGGHGVRDCTATGKKPDGSKASVDLSDMVKRESWPTATARDVKGATGAPSQEAQRAKGHARSILADKVGKGSLNPLWVSQLMGYPDGWVCGCAASLVGPMLKRRRGPSATASE